MKARALRAARQSTAGGPTRLAAAMVADQCAGGAGAWLGWRGTGLAARAESRHPHRHLAAVLGTPMKTEWILLLGCVVLIAIGVAFVFVMHGP